LTQELVWRSPPGILQTVPFFFELLMRNFDTYFLEIRDSEAPLSSSVLIVTGLGFPKPGLKQTKANDLMS
jgi:hypothetical protein